MESLFEIKLNINKYKVFVINNTNYKENKIKFIEEVKDLLTNQNKSIKICFDYEFNNNKIGLAQVMISNKNLSNNIYLFYPPDFNKEETELIKNGLYLTPYVKILHGSESLDIPYIYQQVLHNNLSDIILFTKYVEDTRFACELMENNRCSLYDALFQTESINAKQNEFLLDMYKKNGKVYKINWNTHNMTMGQYMYAAFDVIFLRRLNRILNKQIIKKHNKLNKKLLYEYLQFTLQFRNGHFILDSNDLIKLSDDEKKQLQIRNKDNIGIKIQYFKNPVMSLIRVYMKNPELVNTLLDKFDFKLIKDDLLNIKINGN
jgi:hypothetical protein